MPNIPTNAPRGALVFDLRSLSRQAGSDRTQTRIVPAPEDLRLELAGVPAGADVDLIVRFEAVTEGVLVTASATAPLTGECARCLGPVDSTVTVGFTELYLYADPSPRGSRRSLDKQDRHDKHNRYDKHNQYDKHDQNDEQDDEQDDEERHLDGDLLDLEPAFRDAVVLALPMSPLCRDDCPGLCAQCGVPLAEAGQEHGHQDALDPRWAGLKQLGRPS